MAVVVISVVGPSGRSRRRFTGFTRVVIGRHSDSDLPLEDPSVSLRHAELTLGDSGWTLTDLRSTHGTLVGDEPVGEGHPIQPGDRIEVGPFRLAVEHVEPKPLAAAPYREPGRRAERYQLQERLAVGKMAEVYRAGSRVALKRLLPPLVQDESLVQMFLETGRIAERLHHPNICRVLEVGEAPFGPFIAMDLVDGVDLRALMRAAAGPVDLELAAFIISELCAGLDYAHSLTGTDGIPLELVHREVEPGNIMVSHAGEVKLVGFSLLRARLREHESQPGVIKGQFAYMAPETVLGNRIDHRADLFTVGSVLYELVTGQRAFTAESDFGTLDRVRSAEFDPPRKVNPQLPAALEVVILRALQRDPASRYQRALDLGRALELAVPRRYSRPRHASAVARLLRRLR